MQDKDHPIMKASPSTLHTEVQNICQTSKRSVTRNKKKPSLIASEEPKSRIPPVLTKSTIPSRYHSQTPDQDNTNPKFTLPMPSPHSKPAKNIIAPHTPKDPMPTPTTPAPLVLVGLLALALAAFEPNALAFTVFSGKLDVTVSVAGTRVPLSNVMLLP